MSYSGWILENNCQIGSLFDTNVNKDSENVGFKFKVGEGKVIKGWDEGVQGMKKGGKRVLIIPSELANGKIGNSVVPPNTKLIFEVNEDLTKFVYDSA